MDCKQCAEDLTAFSDGELSAAISEQMRSHLATCFSCSEELRSLRETADFIESHNRKLDLRAGSWNLVQARIAAGNMPARMGFWFSYRWRLATAALAVSAALAIGYVQHQQTQRRNLDLYMSQYIQQREAQIRSRSTAAGAEINSQVENPYADNPFVEIKATLTDNPFRSEDR